MPTLLSCVIGQFSVAVIAGCNLYSEFVIGVIAVIYKTHPAPP